MAKICDVEDCNLPVFGTDKITKKRFCQKHQWMRTDIVRGIKKKKPLSNRNKQDFDIFQFGFKGEKEMFEYLWIDLPHKSQISDRPLMRNHLFYSFFAHVLEKKNYPLYRLNPDNIFLVHPMEHVLIDSGTNAARKNYVKEFPNADFKKFYTRKNILLQEYLAVEKSFSVSLAL